MSAIDPTMTVADLAEDREACEALLAAATWADVDNLQAALRSLLTPPTPPEPTDLAARVAGNDGCEWAQRSDGKWCTIGTPGSVRGAAWERVCEDFGPLTIVTPEPEPRPFRVGDRVRVAENATWVDGFVSSRTKAVRGRVAEVVQAADEDDDVEVRSKGVESTLIASRFLTLIEAAP